MGSLRATRPRDHGQRFRTYHRCRECAALWARAAPRCSCSKAYRTHGETAPRSHTGACKWGDPDGSWKTDPDLPGSAILCVESQNSRSKVAVATVQFSAWQMQLL